MRINLSLLPTKFLAGVITGAVLFSGSAIAYNSYVSNNTPEGGYLLCANTKTKAVTFPDKLSCPSGSKALDLGAVRGLEGPAGPAGPAGQSANKNRPKYSVSTFASVSIPAGTSNYSAVLPLREKAFGAKNAWHNVSVKLNISGNQSSGTVQCQVMPMDSFTGAQTSSTAVNAGFIIFSKILLTQEFSGNFTYYGGDYVLACKSEVAATVNASAIIQETDGPVYLG